MVRYYDKEGKPLTLEQWSQLFEFTKYRVIASDNVNNLWVSTVWLGLDHRHFGDGPPLIFETMIFNTDDFNDVVEMDRYSTLEEAVKGHAAMVEYAHEVSDGPGDP